MSTMIGAAVSFGLFIFTVVFNAPEIFAQSDARPMIGMTLRNVTEGVVEQGESIRVNVQLRLDDSESDEGTVPLSPASGTWVDAVTVEIVDTQGNPVGIQAQPFGQPDKASATLNKNLIAGGLWRFKSGATGSLAPGTYAIRSRLAINNTFPGSGGWTGEVFSHDIPLEIAAPSDVPERRSQRALAVAQEAILDGRLEDAAAGLDALLADERDNVEAWTLRAVVAERANNIFGALQCVDEGQTHYADLNIDEPNLELHAITRRLMAALEKAKNPDEVSIPLDHWSWPPKELLSQKDLPPPPSMENGGPTAPAPEGEDAAQGPGTSSSATLVDEVMVIPAAEAVESDFLIDPRGQWAAFARASSEYGTDRYNAMQSIGAPNVDTYSDNPNAWCHSGSNSKLEWLEVYFSQPVQATELRVRQSYTPGTIAKIEAFAADGRVHVLWEGVDPNTYQPRQIAWFVLRFPATPFPVKRVKLTLDISLISGWKQIDAVQLVGDPLSEMPETMVPLPSTSSPSPKSVTIVPYTDINDGDIFTDQRGQWASSASASSEYGTDRYNALQATGAPNVPTYSDHPNAWCHSGANNKLEWLEVGFEQAVFATELRVRQSYTPGTIAKIEAFAADGRVHVLWEGVDPNTYLPGQIAWFILRFPPTPFPVQRVKLTLNISLISGWKQIDAVQLVGDAP
jgi:hypothetical protein